MLQRHDDKDQSRGFIETLDLSSPWAHLLHPDHRGSIGSPVDLLSFMYKKAFISALQSFFVLFLEFLYQLASYLHLTCHTLRPALFSLDNLFPTFASVLLYEIDVKVFIYAPNLWYGTYFPVLPLICLKHFQFPTSSRLLKILLSILT